MSLLDAFAEDFVIMVKTATDDGYGAFSSSWAEGDTIKAAVTLDTSVQARIASVSGVTDLYTVTTSRSVSLPFHTVLKRVSDQRIFRTTSDGTDKKTPSVATLDMRQVSAEEWKMVE